MRLGSIHHLASVALFIHFSLPARRALMFDVLGRVGIENPTIEVRFQNLNIDAEAYVGNRGIPTFINFFSNKIMVCILFFGTAAS